MNQAEFDSRFRGILFVTTKRARCRMDAAVQFSELADLADGFLVIIAEPGDVFEAVAAVRLARDRLGELNGIVLLGNYDELPPAQIQIACSEVKTSAGEDSDNWVVETDDCYGGNLVQGGSPITADIPVSRLPIVPANGGLLGHPLPGTSETDTSLGIRSPEFVFADDVFASLPNRKTPDMEPSPPLVACGAGAPAVGCLPSGGLKATYHYLVLHGSNGANEGFRGTGLVAVSQSVVLGGSYRGSTLFCGACWGGQIAKLRNNMDAPFEHQESLALIFVDHGANAFVGFTGSHWIPTDTFGGLYNETLHQSFWRYTINEHEPPARALFRARRESLRHLAGRPILDAKEYAAVLKGYWSAICLGLGW